MSSAEFINLIILHLFMLRTRKPKLEAIDQAFASKRRRNINLKFLETNSRQLAYSKNAKKIIHNTPEIIKSFLILSKTDNPEFIDPKNRYHIIKETKIMGQNSNQIYKLIIKTKSGTKKYFIKEMKQWINPTHEMLKRGANAFHELKAIEKLKELGISVIDAHLAYADKDRSFIIYDYIENLPVLWSAMKDRLISKEEYDKLNYKLKQLKSEIKNKYLISDINSMNTFIDLKTKRLYLFDPLPKSIE